MYWFVDYCTLQFQTMAQPVWYYRSGHFLWGLANFTTQYVKTFDRVRNYGENDMKINAIKDSVQYPESKPS